jgi:endonuclease YncB( thermonuclease family)
MKTNGGARYEIAIYGTARTHRDAKAILIQAATYLTILALGLVPSWATDVIIKDGDTIELGGTSFRLDGIDAPEFDQMCLDEQSAVWACGIEARDQLAALIRNGAVRCDDKGPDPVYPAKRIGSCWVEGDDLNLNQRLVREGWALNFEPYAKHRFKADQDDAQEHRRGLWKGCFSTPQDLRRWNKSKARLLGSPCPSDARNLLFPDNPAMPPGCSIKGKISLRAKITGHRGIYHIEGCRSYRSTTKPNRWFCTEEEARAAGFRKAFTCLK